jgi:hypothetical protein
MLKRHRRYREPNFVVHVRVRVVNDRHRELQRGFETARTDIALDSGDFGSEALA